jgi:hypothetical protein
VSRSSSNVSAGLYLGRDRISCVVLQADGAKRSVVSAKTVNIAAPLFKGVPDARTQTALTEALSSCCAELGGRHVPVHVVVPDAALSVAVFELDQVPASADAIERLVEFRLTKELGSNGTCVSQLLGQSEGKSLLLGASMDKAWLAALIAACDTAGIVPWSISATTPVVFNGFHDAMERTGGAMIAITPEAWSLWVWNAEGLARPLRSQWRLGTQDDREIAVEVERALIAYTDGHASRAIEHLHLWSPDSDGALGDAFDRRIEKPCDRRVWPEGMQGTEAAANTASLAACVMAASTA